MNTSDCKRLALIFSIQAEIEGMKAENAERLSNDMSIAYTIDHFNAMAEELRSLAHKHDDEL